MTYKYYYDERLEAIYAVCNDYYMCWSKAFNRWNGPCYYNGDRNKWLEFFATNSGYLPISLYQVRSTHPTIKICKYIKQQDSEAGTHPA